MSTDKKTVIKCPHCGYEYHPSELFMPGDLIGKPVRVLRDTTGAIIYVEYEDDLDQPCYEAHFICDGCDRPFIAEAQITYKTRAEEEEVDFSRETVSLLDD